jgi:hypothetical protein
MTPFRLLTAALAALPLFALSTPAHAAASYDACTNFIPSLPTTITTQGVWCLDKDLGTAIGTGNAITINTNNVTIDCNGFKLGGLLAGLGTMTNGVYANGRSNITVRDCNIRGFAIGVNLEGSSGSGHRIERNRIEGSTFSGIAVAGDGVLVRDNLVIDTGGSTVAGNPWTVAVMIGGRGDVIDNQIDGVDGASSDTYQAIGIAALSSSNVTIKGNRISALIHPVGPGANIGVGFVGNPVADVRDNTLHGDLGISVLCTSSAQVLHGNAWLMGLPFGGCSDGGDNYGIVEIP